MIVDMLNYATIAWGVIVVVIVVVSVIAHLARLYRERELVECFGTLLVLGGLAAWVTLAMVTP